MSKLSKGKIATILAIIIFTTTYFWGRDADAAELGIGLGFGTFNSVGATIQELSIATDDYHWFASYTRIGGTDSDELVADYNDRYVLAYRVFWRRDKDFKPYLSLGASYFTEPPNYLISERLAFNMRFGFRWRDILEVDIEDHDSTAGRANRNRGFDTINLRGVFRF